jgi:hypothetical protein
VTPDELVRLLLGGVLGCLPVTVYALVVSHRNRRRSDEEAA